MKTTMSEVDGLRSSTLADSGLPAPHVLALAYAELADGFAFDSVGAIQVSVDESRWRIYGLNASVLLELEVTGVEHLEPFTRPYQLDGSKIVAATVRRLADACSLRMTKVDAWQGHGEWQTTATWQIEWRGGDRSTIGHSTHANDDERDLIAKFIDAVRRGLASN